MNWMQYGKTIGEPDPKREKGFKAIAHTYSERRAWAICEAVRALEEIAKGDKRQIGTEVYVENEQARIAREALEKLK